MTVGLPGAGIGGLFYLLAALLMPVHEAWLTVTGRSSLARWRVVLQQFSIAGGIAGGTWVSGWLLAAALGRVPGGASGNAVVLQRTTDWLRPTHGLVQLVTLAAILGVTWTLGHLLGRPGTRAAVATTPSPKPLVVPAGAHAAPGRDSRTPAMGVPTPHSLTTRVPTPWRQRAIRAEEG